jgi:hypothetical protein
MECFRLFSMLEAHHDVIRVPNHDHGSPRLLSTSVFSPQIEHIVQVDIGKKRRNDSMNAKDNFEFIKVIRYKRKK